MAKTVTHGRELADHAIKFIRLRPQLIAADPRFAIGRKHCSDLFERKPCGASQCHERKLLHDARIEEAPQAASSDRFYESLLLIEAKRGCRRSGTPGKLGNINAFQRLDLKFT